MSNYKHFHSRLACGLAVFSLTACCGLAPGQPTVTAPTFLGAVTITYVVGSPSAALPDRAMLFTAWITSSGRRDDFPDGKTLLQPRNSPLAYVLDTQAKRATVESANENALAEPDPDQVWRHDAVGKVAVSHESLLGYPCLVRKGLLSVDGRPTPAENWVATVAGRRVALRSRIGSDASLVFSEAVAVRMVPTVPPGLLQVPAGYTVTAMTAPASSDTGQKPQ